MAQTIQGTKFMRLVSIHKKTFANASKTSVPMPCSPVACIKKFAEKHSQFKTVKTTNVLSLECFVLLWYIAVVIWNHMLGGV